MKIRTGVDLLCILCCSGEEALMNLRVELVYVV